MKKVQLLSFALLVAVALGAAQSQSTSQGPSGAGQLPSGVVTPELQPAPVRILSPSPDQTLSSAFVHLRFELVRPALSGEPNFVVQLDEQDPVNTSSTDYTFPDIQPGAHVISVTLVDANGSPVQGGSTIVHFKVQSTMEPAQKSGSRGSKQHTQTLAGAPPEAPIPSELRNEGDTILPLAGSPLPLLSLIGFGLLIGGAAQAMRSRQH